MFEKNSDQNRLAPEPPTTDGIEYPRAASWSSSTVDEILRDPIGKRLFRTFLHEALAEENLLFVEALDELKKDLSAQKIKDSLTEILDKYGSFINLSSVAMTKLRETSESDSPDLKNLEICYKEIYKLLENDQFPRFRRSHIYLDYLEKLLPRAYAERWTTSFDALLGNQVGRYHFRQYLLNVHAEENLRFWESVVEFRGLKNKSTAMLNMGKTIHQQFLKEGAHNEVFLPFGLRQRIEKKIKEKEVDETLFDDAIKHVEQILKNDSYVRFLQSKEYNNLLNKLH